MKTARLEKNRGVRGHRDWLTLFNMYLSQSSGGSWRLDPLNIFVLEFMQ